MIKHRFRTILGDMPREWHSVALSSLLDLKSCTAGDWGDDVGDQSVGVIRSTNFTNDGHFDESDIAKRFFTSDKAKLCKLKAGDILIEKSGGSPVQPVGRVLQIPNDRQLTWFSNFIHLLRPNSEVVRPRYLFWALHELHSSGIIERLQTQTTQMRNLEIRDYLCAKLPLPSLIEQDSISALLDAADEKILHTKELIGITGSLRRDSMQGPLNTLKQSLLHNLILGKFRIPA
jgi:type I restriction enzyme S subunit